MVSEQLPESYLREKPDPVAKGSVVTDASYGASRRRETELSLKFYWGKCSIYKRQKYSYQNFRLFIWQCQQETKPIQW